MPVHQVSETSSSAPGEAADMVLREARRLHRAALSESLAVSLPMLRRLLSTQVLCGLSLPQLHRSRDTVRRKHVLRMLAIEAGHASWEAYRKALYGLRAEELQHFDIVQRTAGYPNLWFSSAAEAEQHAGRHGGRVVRVGRQAVLLA